MFEKFKLVILFIYQKLGHKISLAQSTREDSDDDFIASAEKTQTQIDTAEELINLVEKYLEKI